MPDARGLAVVLLLVAVAGCATGRPTLRTDAVAMPAVRFAHHPTIFVADADLGQSAQAAAFLARERERVAAAGGRLVEERDAGGLTPLPGDLVLRITRNDESTTGVADPGDCYVWAAIFAPFTVGDSFLACLETWTDITHDQAIDVRIFDASGAHVTHELEGDERVARIDTSDRSPLVRARLEVTWATHEPARRESDARADIDYERALGERLADLFVAQALPQLVQAEQRVTPDSLPLVAADTSGGERPSS